jgi:hypothetical protein
MTCIRVLLGICLLLAVFTFQHASVGQTAESGALGGTVSDSTGAVLTDANVRVVNAATGETRQTASQGNGRYTVPLLPPGTYTVEIAKQGFRSVVNSGVRINVAETARLDVVMKVGEVVEKVTVEASPTLAQTESSTVGRVVNEESIESLPLVTRNYTQIIGLSPGIESQVTNASELGRGSGGVSPTQSTAGTFVHGARSYDNNYQMNGISVNDNEGTGGSSGGVPIPNSDTIQEFKVQTGLYDAGFGHNAGANVDIITKGGSNQYHGSLFEFFRNEDLNANNFFFNRAGQPRGVLRQNQFGFTLGGPIVKDKLLFFGSYQGTRQLNGASTAINTTCAATLIEPPLTNDRSAAALGALFAGQTGAQGGTAIAANGSNINPAALALLNLKLPNGSFLIPTPQVVNPGAPFASQGFSAFSEPCRYNEDQFLVNSDYLQSAKSRFSERFFFVNGTQNISFPVGTFVPPGNVPGFPSGVINNSRTFSIAHTYTFSPRWLNVARFGFNYLLGSLAPKSPYKFSDVGITEAAQNDDLPSITIAGSINMGPSGPLEFTQNSYSFDDSLSYVHGRHSLRFGGGLTRLGNDLSNIRTGGNLEFLSFPDFLLGMSAAQNGTAVSNVFASLDALGEFDRHYRAWEANLFVQDDVRVSRSLTLNLGLRYERLGLYGDNLGRNANFDPTKANPNPPAAGTIQGYVVDSNFPGTLPAGVARMSNPWAVAGGGQNTFGPRVGFAWQILPDSTRFVLRGGGGTYFSRPTGEAFVQNVFGAPFSVTRINVGSTNATATLQNPFPAAPPSFPFFPPYSPTTSTTVFDDGQDFQPGVIYEYGLNLQTSLTRNLLLEVGYVGSRGTHLLRQRSADQALSASPSSPIRGITDNTLADVAERKPILGINPDGLVQVESAGASWYNGLEVSLTKRLSKGLQLLASYTYSRTLDTDAAQVNTTAGGNAITIGNQNDARARYGNTDFSRPHRLIISYVYELPGPRNKEGFARILISGWELTGVTTFQAGQYMTVLGTNPNNVFGISEDRASVTPSCNGRYVTPGSVDQKLSNYFNTACFMTPAVVSSDGVGTGFGNSGVGIARGPDQRNWDLAMIKRTVLKWPSEASNVEFRAEMFNVFNTPQFSNPDNSFTSPTFGQISSTAVAARIVQFALKYNF